MSAFCAIGRLQHTLASLHQQILNKRKEERTFNFGILAQEIAQYNIENQSKFNFCEKSYLKLVFVITQGL
jgi:hypothetical protein